MAIHVEEEAGSWQRGQVGSREGQRRPPTCQEVAQAGGELQVGESFEAGSATDQPLCGQLQSSTSKRPWPARKTPWLALRGPEMKAPAGPPADPVAVLVLASLQVAGAARPRRDARLPVRPEQALGNGVHRDETAAAGAAAGAAPEALPPAEPGPAGRDGGPLQGEPAWNQQEGQEEGFPPSSRVCPVWAPCMVCDVGHRESGGSLLCWL